MKTILVTGSTGFLGSNLVKKLAEEKKYNVIGAVEDPTGKTDRFDCGEYLHTVSNDNLLDCNISGIDMIVNCAFARSNDPGLLTNALDFTAKLAITIKKLGISSLINISSQGVYKRLPAGILQKEDSEIEPIDMYSMAKYAAEKIFISAQSAPFITNIRLASINMKQRFLFAFVKKVFTREKIKLTTPNQNAALLDIKDAVQGIKALIDLPNESRREIYNLGIGTQITISDYAERVVNRMNQHGYEGHIEYDIASNNIANSGMDCSAIMKDTGWRPHITVENMIDEYVLQLQLEGQASD